LDLDEAGHHLFHDVVAGFAPGLPFVGAGSRGPLPRVVDLFAPHVVVALGASKRIRPVRPTAKDAFLLGLNRHRALPLVLEIAKSLSVLAYVDDGLVVAAAGLVGQEVLDHEVFVVRSVELAGGEIHGHFVVGQDVEHLKVRGIILDLLVELFGDRDGLFHLDRSWLRLLGLCLKGGKKQGGE